MHMLLTFYLTYKLPHLSKHLGFWVKYHQSDNQLFDCTYNLCLDVLTGRLFMGHCIPPTLTISVAHQI